jgi:hypothetical protein
MESAQNSTGAALVQLSRRNGDMVDSHGQIAQLVAEKQTLSSQLKVSESTYSVWLNQNLTS